MTILDEILINESSTSHHKKGCQCGKCNCNNHQPNCKCKKCLSTETFEDEFFLGNMYRSVRAAMRRGKGVWAAKLAMQKGERDENKLTNIIFYSRHPELPKNYKIKTYQKNLKKEWLNIRNFTVRPMIRQRVSPQIPYYGDHFSKEGLSCTINDFISKAKPGSNYIWKAKSPRDLRKIDSVVLHQMAFNRGNNLDKYLRVKSHYIIMQDGQIAQLYPDETYVHASNKLNRRSVAIEFAGNFPNEKGRYWIPKGKPNWSRNRVTPAQIKAGRCLLANLKKRLPNIQYVFAHRQSSNSRSNDPGPDLWYGVAEYAIKKLGYNPDGRNHSIGSGKPIPISWTTKY